MGKYQFSTYISIPLAKLMYYYGVVSALLFSTRLGTAKTKIC